MVETPQRSVLVCENPDVQQQNENNNNKQNPPKQEYMRRESKRDVCVCHRTKGREEEGPTGPAVMTF